MKWKPKHKCKERMMGECGVYECKRRRLLISGLDGCICRKDNCYKERQSDSKWKPKEGVRYWWIYLSSGIRICHLKWADLSTGCDNIYSLGNCFRTRAEAEQVARKIKKLLKESANGK